MLQTPPRATTNVGITWAMTAAVCSSACLVPPQGPGSAPSTPVGAPAPSVTVNAPPRRPDGPSGLLLPSAKGIPRPAGKPGGLTVLDWAGFKAAVSYTFDDSNASQINHYPELRALGVRMTFYLITGKPESSDPMWTAAIKDGHEIGNHSQSHAHQATEADLDAASAFIHDKLGVTAWTMAAPYGDPSYRAPARSRFLFNRSVGGGVIRPYDGTDPFVLPCFVPAANASPRELDAGVLEARSSGGWAIVLVHGFTGGSDGAYQAVRIEDFVTAVTHARSFEDLWIDSVVNVGAYWTAQRLIKEAAPTTTPATTTTPKIGQTKEVTTTWSWTLPPHFPPNKYVRVKVDGGTLFQRDRPLSWDEHGFYEVALDAGSVTLGP